MKPAGSSARRVRPGAADAIAGLYVVTSAIDDTKELLRRADAALAGGARVIQYRHKRASPLLAREQALALRALTRTRGAAFIVNDDEALALRVDADGVHLGREDTSVAQARGKLGRSKIIGVSCYDSLERARVAREHGADYVAFGSFFASVVKPGAVRARLELLVEAREALEIPLVAIGGIDAGNAPRVIEAGADAVAVISAVFEARDVEASARAIAACFEPRVEDEGR